MDMHQKRKIRQEKRESEVLSNGEAYSSNISWYPGHMTKAIRMMKENIKLIDLVIELVDARLPLSSRNPDIDTLAANKARIILLNKSDLADSVKNSEWIEYFKEMGIHALLINSKTGSGVKDIKNLVMVACKDKIERDRKRGIINRTIKAMVVGIPNVGKSTFINALAGKACTKTGNKPGVTKGKQWIRLNKDIELLDTPGILWPKFEDKTIGMKLAFIGSINDDIIIIDELAVDLLKFLDDKYLEPIYDRYNIDKDIKDAVEIIRCIASNRGCILKGNELNILKAATILLDEFRSGRLGRFTLDSITK